MSNLPPGTSAGDPRAPWNAPDPEDREKVREEDEMLIEDGAAIFYRTSYWAHLVGVHQGHRETIREYGPEDSETESIRLDVDRVILRREREPDITYLASSEHHSSYTEWLFDEAIDSVTTAFMEDEFSTIISCDPPSKFGDGFVSAESGNYEVWFKQ